MYKKILITTDGSALSSQVALAGVALAAQLQAQVVALHVIPAYQYPMDVEFLPAAFPSEEEYRTTMEKLAQSYLAIIANAAQQNKLDYIGISKVSDATAQQIIACAKEQGCDLIYMGSHGRGGWGQLLLGSVTNKVLSNCRIPVLVDRLQQEPEQTSA